MPTDQRLAAFRRLRNAMLRKGGGLGDAELLERFLTQRDEAAFEALLRRHGPMVLGVCRRVLRQEQDAEDAFQATFLVLARRAAAIRKRQSVGHWLYGVAYRTALEARSAAARRRELERHVMNMPEPAAEPGQTFDDLLPVLDVELCRLPEKYRAAIVLCDLECRPRRDAAQQLGIAEGTLSSRLATGRRMLAERLACRGIHLSAGALAASLSFRMASAAVPSPLARATLWTALAGAAGRSATAGGNSANVLALAERVLRAMFLTRLRFTALLLLSVVVLGAGAAVRWGQARHRDFAAVSHSAGPAARGAAHWPEPAPAMQAAPQVPQEIWALDLQFKDPRFLLVNVPGRGKQLICYLPYQLVNRTGEPRLAILDFQLEVAGGPTIADTVFGGEAFAHIAAVEDPAGKLDLKNSVTLSASPIPVAKGGDGGKVVSGLAIWEGVDPGVKEFRVVVTGLSNAWVLVEGKEPPTIRRKVLELTFKRDGETMVFVPPARWVYHQSPRRPAAKEEREKSGKIE